MRRRRRFDAGAAALAVIAAAGGCHRVVHPQAPVQRAFELPAITERLAPAIVFGPVAHPAVSYAEPGSLDAVAGELAPIPARGATISDELLAFALRSHGIIERGQVALARTRAEVDDQLARVRESPELVAGIGGDDATGYAIVTTHRPRVVFSAAPRAVQGGVKVAGTIADGFRHAHATLTREDRTHESVAISIAGDGGFELDLRCNGHVGTQWLAFEAVEDPHPFAVVPFECGQPPAEVFYLEPSANTNAPDPGVRLQAIIDRERAAAGLAPLKIDPLTEHVARTYAARMAAADSVEHELDGTDALSRLRAGGREPEFSTEATLQADDLAHAVESLWNDRGYREAVMSPRATHIGLGVVRARSGKVYIAIECIEIPPLVDTPALAARLTAALAHHELDPRLAGIARDYATYLALGRPAEETAAALHDRMYKATTGTCPPSTVRRHVHVDVTVRNVFDPATFDAASLDDVARALAAVGVGVAQSARQGPLAGRIFAVALFQSCAR